MSVRQKSGYVCRESVWGAAVCVSGMCQWCVCQSKVEAKQEQKKLRRHRLKLRNKYSGVKSEEPNRKLVGQVCVQLEGSNVAR